MPAMASAARARPSSTDLGLVIIIDGPPTFTQATLACARLGSIKLPKEQLRKVFRNY